VAKTQINQQDIKKFLTQQVRDDVNQLRRELAIQRLNIGKAIGVGNMNDYIKEWEQDFPNSTISARPAQPKNKALKRITQTKKKVKL
jgi:hypothetical protein